MFEKASRLKLRFSVPDYGHLSVEDLWDLSQESLNVIYMKLAAQIKQTEVSSLLDRTRPDEELTLRLNLVQHVFNTKEAERLERANKLESRAKIDRLTEILAQKQDQALGAMSEEEIAAAIQELKDQL